MLATSILLQTMYSSSRPPSDKSKNVLPVYSHLLVIHNNSSSWTYHSEGQVLCLSTHKMNNDKSTNVKTESLYTYMDVTRDSNIENNTTCVALFISRHNGCGYGVALNCFYGAVSSPLALSHGIFLGHDGFL